MRSGGLRGSIYWVLLFGDWSSVSKTIIPNVQEHFLASSGPRYAPPFGGLGLKQFRLHSAQLLIQSLDLGRPFFGVDDFRSCLNAPGANPAWRAQFNITLAFTPDVLSFQSVWSSLLSWTPSRTKGSPATWWRSSISTKIAKDLILRALDANIDARCSGLSTNSRRSRETVILPARLVTNPSSSSASNAFVLVDPLTPVQSTLLFPLMASTTLRATSSIGPYCMVGTIVPPRLLPWRRFRSRSCIPGG